MEILDWIQTICAVAGLLLSLFATNEVVKIKRQYKIGNISNKISQSAKGSNNKQEARNDISIK